MKGMDTKDDLSLDMITSETSYVWVYVDNY